MDWGLTMKTQVDIKLLNGSKQEVTYETVETVGMPLADGTGEQTFTAGEPLDNILVALDFANGDQQVDAPEGYVVRSAVILKPESLKPENIKKNVDVCGVVGELIGDTEERTVNLDFSVGSVETELLPLTPYDDFSFHSEFRIYGVQDAAPYTLTVGETYFVEWDGEVRECVAQDAGALVPGMVYLGNGAKWLLPGNGEKFVIGTANNGYALYGSVEDNEAGGSHTVRIYQLTEGSDTSDMVVTPTSEGKVMSKVTITKPEGAEQVIAKGETLAGIPGEYVTPGTTKEIEPYFGNCLITDNPEEVSALLSDPSNIGKYVKYTGEMGDFTSGQVYKVVDEYEAARRSPATAVEVTSDTVLTATLEGCKVGDLVVAAFAIRSDLVSLSDGWVLISTSQGESGINPTFALAYEQTLSFAYKYATSATEEITVTQATAARIYINMVSLNGAVAFEDAGYQYQDNSAVDSCLAATFTRPEGKLVLWALTKMYWGSASWQVSNDAALIQGTSSTAPRLLLAIDTSTDESVTFTSGANNTTDVYMCGALSIELEPSVRLIEVDKSEVPTIDQNVTADGDERWNEVVIKKPETLVPENIAKGVDVGGVIGALAGITKEITPDFSAGNHTVTAEGDELWGEVIIKKPSTLVAGNIKSGVNIAGIAGSLVSYNVVVKQISGSTATSGNKTIFTSSELSKIGFANASKKFALLFTLDSGLPDYGHNALAYNLIRYPYLVDASSDVYGIAQQYSRAGKYSSYSSISNAITNIATSPWTGTTVNNSMFYLNGALVYNLGSSMKLSLNASTSAKYIAIAGCY